MYADCLCQLFDNNDDNNNNNDIFKKKKRREIACSNYTYIQDSPHVEP